MPVPALVGYQVMQTHAGELILPPNSRRYSHVLTLGGQIRSDISTWVILRCNKYLCSSQSSTELDFTHPRGKTIWKHKTWFSLD